MRSHEVHRGARGPLRLLAVAGAAAATLTLSGCTPQIERGWLPSDRDMTNHTDRIMTLWNGSWIAALVVGVIVWGLTFWVMIAYRRRRGETGLPLQVRYNIPMEIMYTIIPVMMVGVLFYYTARDQSVLISTETKPDVRIGVVAKQWSWDFNYLDSDVYETGTQAQLTGRPGTEDALPTLYLPQGKNVEFILTSRDVIHSFWIPRFLMKMDMLPGIVNRFQLVPNKVGTYQGKCAELCGEYHSEMLFNVKVVPQAEYDAHLQALRQAGQIGQLATQLGRSELSPPGERELEESGSPR